MKKILLITCLAALILAAPKVSLAQENALKVNIFSPLLRTLNLQYERVLSDNSSFQLGFFYTGVGIEETRFSGIGLTPEYRFYLSDSPAPEGVYIAPFLRYQNFNLTEEFSSAKGSLNTFGGGLIVGKQWIFKERIALDIFIGPSYSSGNVNVSDGDGSVDFSTGFFSGFGVRTGLCLGIAF